MTTFVSWAITYWVHATLIIGTVWLLSHLLRERWLLVDRLWKVALVGALFTASLQLGVGIDPLLGTLEIAEPAAEQAVAEKVTIIDAGGQRVVFSEQVQASAASASAVPEPVSWPLYLGWLLIAGAAVGLGRLVYHWLKLQRRIDSRVTIHRGELYEMLREMRGDDAVTLSITPKLTVPIAIGVLDTEIVLPKRIGELAYDEQRAMIAHELGHLRAHDPLWKMTAEVICAALFFQPLNLLVRARMAHIAELRSDDWAARQTGERLALARCLSEVAGWVVEDSTLEATAPAMAAKRSNLGERVGKLLSEVSPRARRMPAAAPIAVLLFLAALIWAVPSFAITDQVVEEAVPTVQTASLDQRLEAAIAALEDVKEIPPPKPEKRSVARFRFNFGLTGDSIEVEIDEAMIDRLLGEEPRVEEDTLSAWADAQAKAAKRHARRQIREQKRRARAAKRHEKKRRRRARWGSAWFDGWRFTW